MAELKLAQLPDRKAVKITISVLPDLNEALAAYATIYNEAYGQEEPVTELIPHMLAAFLAGDRAFARARAQLLDKRS